MSHGVSVSCPSCGMSIDQMNALTRSITCQSCGNWVYLGSNGWETAGLFEHSIDAPSMLQLGKSGRLNDRRFVVTGRVRLSYEEGFWDEWWLEFDDGINHWLEEDDGVYRLHKEMLDVPESNSAAYLEAKVGGFVEIGSDAWFVTERTDAQVAGVQGSLPVAIVPGEQVVCVDVMGKGRKMSIEAAEKEVQISQSTVVRASGFEWD